MINPFYLNYDPKGFCNREVELAWLREQAENGRNSLLHSPRRLGKTALIRHLFNQLEEENAWDVMYVDLFSSSTMADLVRLFGEAALRTFHKRNLMSGVRNLFAGLQPTISLGLDGSPKLGLEIQPRQVESTLSDLFMHLEKRRKPILVAFDEFQTITEYPEKAEAILRTHMQMLTNVRFIFAGSSSHLLEAMFLQAARPFYQSAEPLILKKIPDESWNLYIRDRFENTRKVISDEAIREILDFVSSYTFYVPVICNQVWTRGGRKIDREDVRHTCSQYLESRKEDYQRLFQLLPDNQRRLTIALAREESEDQPTSIEFITRHKLPSPSSVHTALNSLLEKEILYQEGDSIRVYDVMFMRFLQEYY